MFRMLAPVVKPFAVPVRVMMNGFTEYEQGKRLLFRMQLKGRPGELVAGENYDGIVNIILDPLMTVDESSGSKERRR